jgi:hypothetical protein
MGAARGDGYSSGHGQNSVLPIAGDRQDPGETQTRRRRAGVPVPEAQLAPATVPTVGRRFLRRTDQVPGARKAGRSAGGLKECAAQDAKSLTRAGESH